LGQIPIVAIIDDDASLRKALAAIVRSVDLMAYPFASSQEFLECPELHETACIIADVQMPEMTGLELQHFLRSKSLNIPIILITAYPNGSIRDQALRAGVVGFFDKPFNSSKLIACLQQAIRTKRG
jgi:FixJ family two-component response regulator